MRELKAFQELTKGLGQAIGAHKHWVAALRQLVEEQRA